MNSMRELILKPDISPEDGVNIGNLKHLHLQDISRLYVAYSDIPILRCYICEMKNSVSCFIIAAHINWSVSAEVKNGTGRTAIIEAICKLYSFSPDSNLSDATDEKQLIKMIARDIEPDFEGNIILAHDEKWYR